MAAKNKFMNAMKMPAIADMFSSEADRQRESGDLVTEVYARQFLPAISRPEYMALRIMETLPEAELPQFLSYFSY